jgi:hypothetical protein
MQLFKDMHLVNLELLSNATTIDSALNYIKSKGEQQTQQNRLASDLVDILKGGYDILMDLRAKNLT